MIPKRIPLRNPKASSFKRLTEYITNSQGKHERVGTVRITGCESTNPTWAADEIESIQAQNKRTTIDKTYHLLISFRETDRPSSKVLREIEDKMCAELGYGEHQRISAVHHDTDHIHLHIAINKIHPKTSKAIEPYYDKKRLGELAEKLEIEYGLERDNHTPRMTAAASRAQDMEKAAGIESMIGWIKRGCLDDLLAARSWKALHEVLGKNGLQLLPQNNGLIITNGQGIGAKASSVHRQLSKPALVKKLGAYHPAPAQAVKAAAQYAIRPMTSKVNTDQLWSIYQQERGQRRKGQLATLQDMTKRRDRLIEAAKKAARTKRRAIKLIHGQTAKKIMYHMTSKKLLQEITKINQAYQKERSAITEQNKTSRLIWHDWLKAKAYGGDAEALAVLRARYERPARQGNMIASPGNDNPKNLNASAKIDTVTKRGTVHYQIPSGVLRDEGDKLRMADNLPPEALKAALELAIKRFGKDLAVQGSKAFQEQMVQTAAANRLKVVFAEAQMEAKRIALINELGQTPKSKIKAATGTEAAQRYIAERNEKHRKGLDVLPHKLYTAADIGKFTHAGIRKVDNQFLALLQSARETLVMPVDEKTAVRMRHSVIGSPIEVTEQGVIKTRNQNRGR